jgi:phosphatidylinositol-4,5-bisphosphate 3-kinase
MMLMSRKGVLDSLESTECHVPAYMRKSQALLSTPTITLWRLDRQFRLQINSATYVNVKEVDLIYVRVGIFHGRADGVRALCFRFSLRIGCRS